MACPGPALAAVALLVLLVLTGGCSDMLERSQADAVVVLDAPDRAAVLRLRQEVLAQAGTWGGVRVGEKTAEQDGDTALTFALPGPNLDIALSGIGRLKAEVRSTSIDVDPEQVDRTTPATGTDGRAEDNSVRLRVEIDEQRPAGAGAALRLVMAVFSVVGMVATGLWIVHWWRRRGEEPPPSDGRRRRIVDVRGDPPTEETPQVPWRDW